MRGYNDDELVDLLEYGKAVRAEVRFIEYMDVGGATSGPCRRSILAPPCWPNLRQHYGRITPVAARGSAPAEQFILPDGTVFGIIASTTAPFCRACDRSRLTADGMWLLCLYATAGIDLRQPLRAGMAPTEIKALIAQHWQQRRDRGAEERQALESPGLPQPLCCSLSIFVKIRTLRCTRVGVVRAPCLGAIL